MTRLRNRVRVDAPKEKVWGILADFGGVSRYNPTVTTSRSTSEDNGGVGASRHCDLTIRGSSIEERIVEWNEGDSYTLEVYDGTRIPPYRSALAHLEVEEDGAGTIVTGTFEYSLKYGLFGALMDRLAVRSQSAKAWTRFLAGIKQHAETGETVERSTRLDLASVRAAS